MRREFEDFWVITGFSGGWNGGGIIVSANGVQKMNYQSTAYEEGGRGS